MNDLKEKFKKSIVAILELEKSKLSNETINLICNNFEFYLEPCIKQATDEERERILATLKEMDDIANDEMNKDWTKHCSCLKHAINHIKQNNQ